MEDHRSIEDWFFKSFDLYIEKTPAPEETAGKSGAAGR